MLYRALWCKFMRGVVIQICGRGIKRQCSPIGHLRCWVSQWEFMWHIKILQTIHAISVNRMPCQFHIFEKEMQLLSKRNTELGCKSSIQLLCSKASLDVSQPHSKEPIKLLKRAANTIFDVHNLRPACPLVHSS